MQFDNGITRAVLQRSGSIDIDISPSRAGYSYYPETPTRSHRHSQYYGSPGSLGTTRTSRLSSKEELEQELQLVEEELKSRRSAHKHSSRHPEAIEMRKSVYGMPQGMPEVYNQAFTSQALRRGGLSEDEYSSTFSSSSSRATDSLRRSYHHSPLTSRATGGSAKRQERMDISKRIQAFKFRSHGINPAYSPQATSQQALQEVASPLQDSEYISADGIHGSFGRTSDFVDNASFYHSPVNAGQPRSRQSPLVSPPQHSTAVSRAAPRRTGRHSGSVDMVQSPLEHLRYVTAGGSAMMRPGDSDDEVLEVPMGVEPDLEGHQRVRDQMLLAKEEEEKFRRELRELEVKMNQAEAAKISVLEETKRERRVSSAKLEQKANQVRHLNESINKLKSEVEEKNTLLQNMRSEQDELKKKLSKYEDSIEVVQKKLRQALAEAADNQTSSNNRATRQPNGEVETGSMNPKEMLKEGMVFIKHGKKGKPHPRFVCLSQNEQEILYGELEAKSGKISHIPIQDIKELKKGQATSVFGRSKRERPHACFSIITESRTLDLEMVPFGELSNARRAIEQRARDYWFDAINALITP